MTAVIKKHVQYDYYIRVYSAKKADGCYAEFPKNCFNDTSFGKYFYHLNDDGVEVYFTTDGVSKTQKVNMPKYARRMFVLADILFKCKKLNMSCDLVLFFDSEGNQKSKISDIVGNSELDSKERKLNDGFSDLLLGKLNDDDYRDVKNGLDCLKKLFESDGIK